MKIVDNVRGKFPVANRPTPFVSFVKKVAGRGESKQVATIAAIGSRLARKGAMMGEGMVREKIKDTVDHIGHRGDKADKGKSEFHGVGIRQRVFEKTSGCSCNCGK